MIDYDRIAVEYSLHRMVHPEVLRNLLSGGGINGDCRVLEVGCGTGNYAVAVEAAVGCRCWGIDASHEMLASAGKSSGSVTFQVGRAEQLEFPAGFFDLVFSVDVIHHLRDITAYLGEAYRVLKHGGRLCTVTDSEWIIKNRQPLAVYFPDTVDVDLERYPRLAAPRAAMEAVGFDNTAEDVVEFPYQLTDSQAYRDKAFSSLHLIPEETWKRGHERMEGDLVSGSIPCVSRYALLWGTKSTGSRHS